MAISRKEIEHIAVLARLDSNGGIFDRLAEDMQGIVSMVDKLQQLDLGDITDQIDTERVNALREDVAQPESDPETLVKPNAPDFQAGGVAVPRVVE
ncbi:MAG: Asp-tRNA(Asn)/Glu-tRNA(Gln) amidotransferase subunit GatC [Clostridia bacterium]|nr:Asp-tRNA(Asn)/Glu-tRNA(Gln) amidotransferase subunit GatC [Clostridia bacterium]